MRTRLGFHFVASIGAAAIAAAVLAAMAHSGLGMSRATIRFDALSGAAAIAALWLAGYFPAQGK
jgi:hypothetical protein